MDSHNRDQSALHHIRRSVNNRPDDDTSEGKERQVFINEEETNQRDVMVVDDCIMQVSQLHKSREHCLRERQERLLLEEIHQDEQLKELGLYEEGMTREQKRQLLEVVAASRETAREEENRRQKSKHWEKQFLYEGDDKRDNYDMELKYHFDGNDEQMSDSLIVHNRERNNSPNKITKNQTVSSLSDLDEDTQPLCSQELFRTPFSDETDNTPYSIQDKDHQKSVPESSVRSPTIHHIKDNATLDNKAEDDVQCTTCQASVQNATQEQLDVWPSPDSPISISLLCPRFLPNMVEKVPFFCPLGMNPNDYTSKILQSINQYHAELHKLQRNSLRLCHWGEPVVVGRHYPNSLDVSQRGLSLRQMPENAHMMRKMVAEHCIETTIEDDSYSLPDLEEWTPDSATADQTKEEESCQKHVSVLCNTNCDSDALGTSNQCLSTKQDIVSKEAENDTYSIPLNKLTEDCVTVCESNDSHSVKLESNSKKLSRNDEIPCAQIKQLERTLTYGRKKPSNIDNSVKVLKIKEAVSTVVVEKILSSQTEKIRILDDYSPIKVNEHTDKQKLGEGGNIGKMNHIISSTSSIQSHQGIDDKNSSKILQGQGDPFSIVNCNKIANTKNATPPTWTSCLFNRYILQDSKVIEADIQIECLPSKRDKRNYTRGQQQITKPGKIIKEDRQRKRKFEEDIILQETIQSSGSEILSPLKRKVS